MRQTTHGFSVAAAQLIEAACRARDGDSEAAQAYIAHAMALLDGRPSTAPVRANPAPPPAPSLRGARLASWQARRLMMYIDAHLGGRIAIDDLAALLRLSKCHLCRAFKSTFGVTAHTWIMRRRVEVAQTLLLTTEASLSEISLSCGMSDQSHFTRTFRRLLGETPHSWRRNQRDAMDEHVNAPTPIRATLNVPAQPAPARVERSASP
ncbi:MAG: AraC family transcriptional regulator [Gammaproteobacteria bacterium]